VRLEGRPFLCYTPASPAPHLPAPPHSDRPFTFGSFNTLAKVTPRVVRVWARVLVAVPASRLVLKSKALADPAVRANLHKSFESHGVTRDRVDLMGLLPALKDHLESYALMDVALDTFRYAGTTTTVEALYMGVPVVTLVEPGNHAHNVGRTLLHAVGLKDLVAASEDEFVRIAAGLAARSDATRLGREQLRRQVTEGVLGDARGYMRTMENIYEAAYGIWRRRGVGAAKLAAKFEREVS
jgi:protein O-GlcNAc transferase